MKRFIVLSFCLLAIFSCSKNETPQVLTFEVIEEEFHFPKPLSETSKQIILERFGSLESYRTFLISKGGSKLPDRKRINSNLYAEMKSTFDKSYFGDSKEKSSKSGFVVQLGEPDMYGVCHIYGVQPDDNILAIGLDQAIDLPYSCWSGSCTTCAMRLIGGSIEQPEQTFLDPCQIDAGYVLSCVAYPKSDCALLTHVEEELY